MMAQFLHVLQIRQRVPLLDRSGQQHADRDEVSDDSGPDRGADGRRLRF